MYLSAVSLPLWLKKVTSMNIVMFKQDTQNHVFTKLDLIIRSRTNELRSNF